MECLIQVLSCGFNATGNSVLVSFEKRIRQETKIINRIFVNVGDSCQRVCQENRIKLHTVSTILITSLAPHNLSGFAGMFLALSDIGVGELHVYGPSGLKSYLNALLPFINRKYPELKIEEIEEERIIHIKGGVIQLRPVFNADEPRRIIATAASFILRDASTFAFDNNEESLNPLLRFLPAAHYFQTFPTIEELLSSSKSPESNVSAPAEDGETQLITTASDNNNNNNHFFCGYRVSRPIVIFVPIAVASHFGNDNVNDFYDETSIPQDDNHDNSKHNITTRPFSTDRRVMLQNIKEVNSCEDILSPAKKALTDLERLANKYCALAIVLPNILNGIDEVELRCPQTNLFLNYLSSSVVSEFQNKRHSKKRNLSLEMETINKDEMFAEAKPLPAVRKHFHTFLKLQNDNISNTKDENNPMKTIEHSSDSEVEEDAAFADVDRDDIDLTKIVRTAKPLTTIHILLNKNNIQSNTSLSPKVNMSRVSIVKRILHDIQRQYKGKLLQQQRDNNLTDISTTSTAKTVQLQHLTDNSDSNNKIGHHNVHQLNEIIINYNNSTDNITNNSNNIGNNHSLNTSDTEKSEVDSISIVSPSKRSHQMMVNDSSPSQNTVSKAMNMLSSLNRNAAALFRNHLFLKKKTIEIKSGPVETNTNDNNNTNDSNNDKDISSSSVLQNKGLILDTISITPQSEKTEHTQLTSPATLTALTDLSLRAVSPIHVTASQTMIVSRPLPPIPPSRNNNNTTNAIRYIHNTNQHNSDNNSNTDLSILGNINQIMPTTDVQNTCKPLPPLEPYQFITENRETSADNTNSDAAVPATKKFRGRPQLTLDLGAKNDNNQLPTQSRNSQNSQIQSIHTVKNLTVDAFKVRFLGTGCAAPSTQRANSAILVTLLAPPPPCVPKHHSEIQSIQNMKRMRRNDQGDRIHSVSATKLPFSAAPDNEETNISHKISTENTEKLNTNNAQSSALHDSREEGPSVLLDCGEGAASQLFQLCGGDVSHFDRLLLSLRVIWISHHHADHAAGLGMLLHHIRRAQMRQRRSLRVRSLRTALTRLVRSYPAQQWDKYRIRDGLSSPQIEPGRVLLLASETVLRATEFCLSVAGLDDLVSFVPITNSLYAGLTGEVQAVTDGRLMRLTSVSVQHCHSSFALVLEHSLGSRLVYSGDCRPSPSLIRVGRDCQLLIHEATFDNCEAEEALKKRHSTYNEALQVATQMRAERIVLTHFSQRYSSSVTNKNDDPPKVSTINDDVSQSPANGQEMSSSDKQRQMAFGRRRPRNGLFGAISGSLDPSPTVRGTSVGSDIDVDNTQKIDGKDLKTNGRLIFANDFTMFRFPSQFEAVSKASVNPFNTDSSNDKHEERENESHIDHI